MRTVWTHGRMNAPAARNTAWRYGFNTPPNYNDNELNCGGAGVQHTLNGKLTKVYWHSKKLNRFGLKYSEHYLK